MAKIFEKMKDLMFGEYEDADDDEYDEEYEEQPAVTELPYQHRETVKDSRDRDYRERDYRERNTEPTPLRRSSTSSSSRTAPQVINGGKSRSGTSMYSVNTNVTMQVVIIKPESYEDAQEISNQIRAMKPVVVNLEKVEFPLAQRIMDFLSGTCYSLDGSIQRVANNIFIIAPENVEISGDFKEELKSKGFNLPWANSGR